MRAPSDNLLALAPFFALAAFLAGAQPTLGPELTAAIDRGIRGATRPAGHASQRPRATWLVMTEGMASELGPWFLDR
jgi:hypothetical protein